ncbi:class I lanthipeptide [Taibaiella chishuiensis]|uniref:Uncharacterized protein n=1 Tax=Taibaiella chishuiensis TaxID=1434707 RepID=A0A2P8CY41_9BACT|nr:class I lanthipeptide [Taibaiella chishuiensis]PSK89882.1 hypothetical protein B0I18_110183 [Taibaiella chishuiensis]
MKKKQLHSKLGLQKHILARLNHAGTEQVKGGEPQTCTGGRFSLCVIIESHDCPSRPACVYPTLQPDCL